jgi:ribosome biogenesis GTPase
MHRLRHGGWLIDTPGMRELQLVDVADALEDVFSDIVELATRCRFTDCGHAGEPGCAVQSALDSGRLDADRLRRYHKLQAEERRNSASLAERRARDRSTGKFYKSVLAAKKHQRDADRD